MLTQAIQYSVYTSIKPGTTFRILYPRREAHIALMISPGRNGITQAASAALKGDFVISEKIRHPDR